MPLLPFLKNQLPSKDRFRLFQISLEESGKIESEISL
jgi:hypothetical protein